MKNSKISVIIPVFNGEKYIEKCINRILLEKEYLHEIVVINDGSLDRTMNRLQPFLAEEKLKVVSQENKGVSAARNKGIAFCSGDWMVFCDVDDDIAPGFFCDIKNEIEKRNETDLICYARGYVGVLNQSENDNINNLPKKNALSMIFTNRGQISNKDFLLRSVWSKVFKKQIIIEKGIIFDESISYGEDALFMLECVLHFNRIDLIHRGYYSYVQNVDGACKSGGRAKDVEGFKKLENVINEYRYTFSDCFNDLDIEAEKDAFLWNYGKDVCGRVIRGTQKEQMKTRRRLIVEICNYMKKYKVYSSIKDKVVFTFTRHFPTLYILYTSKKM